MDVTANIVRTAVSNDGLLSTLTDQTVYGGGNEERTEVAVFLTAYKVNLALELSALTVQAFDPEDITEFSVTNGQDGRHRYLFIITPRWDIIVTYNRYDIVWSVAQQAFYQYINATPSSGNAVTVTAQWTPITDPTSVIGGAEEPQNCSVQVYERILNYQVSKCFGNILITTAKENCEGDCGCSSKSVKNQRRIETVLSVMVLSDQRQQYAQGEKFALEGLKYCNDCGCLNR